jgi:hypothetical protein
MALDIDLDTYSPADADNLGELPAPGRYHARLDSADCNHKSKGGLTGKHLTFVLLTGRAAGYKVEETLWDNGSDDVKTRKAKDRQVRFAKRLGLLVVNGDKLAIAPGKHDFNDCLGAEVVIQIKHEKWESQDKTKSGTQVRMEMFGIWGVEDPEVKDVPKAPGGKSIPMTATSTQPAAAKSQQFDPSEL